MKCERCKHEFPKEVLRTVSIVIPEEQLAKTMILCLDCIDKLADFTYKNR